MKLNKTPIIFKEGPISRSYINVLRELNIKNTNIIYLNKSYSLKLYEKILFKKYNHYPLKFLSDKNCINFIEDIEKFFSLSKGFIRDTYIHKNIYDFKNIIRINSDSINSKESVQIIKNHPSDYFINTGKEILKEIFISKKRFFHIHPGFLPDIRGADGTLNSIFYLNEFGCTFFEMTREIDKGNIYDRIKFNLKKFRLNNYKKYDTKDIYRIWYSFFDMALRAHLFKKMLKNNLEIVNSTIITDSKNSISKYYSFMNDKNLKEVFKKIFDE